jgi:sortase A
MKTLEVTFWTVGIALILCFLGAQAWGEIERQRGIAAFVESQQAGSGSHPALAALSDATADDSIHALVSRQTAGDEVLAILRIPEIGLELPVRYGTDEQVLRRGPGLIEGTALPGSAGNVAIAAHRDIHFRGLKDLELGDLIELEMPDRMQPYIVVGLSVVEPTDVHVLEEAGQPVLTLVTCYPFYFVGNAPKRYVVRAEAAGYLHLNP